MDYQPTPLYSLMSVRNLYTIYHLTFDKNYQFAGERHNFWELGYLISGQVGCTSGDSVYHLSTGDAILESPNLFHNLWTMGDDPCELFMISFDGKGLESRLTTGIYTLTESEQKIISDLLHELPSLFQGFDATEYTPLQRIASLDNIGYQMIKSYLELLCLSLMRRGASARNLPSSDEQAMLYAHITSWLREHLEDALTVQDICRGVFESSGKIKDVFRRFTGGGVMNYYNNLRSEHIMELLSAGYTVQAAAAVMNFSSPYYLSYFFKRETGMTPREYLHLVK